MPAYTYLAADLLTGAILAELPLSDVTLERQLSGSGSWSGKLAGLDDPHVAAIDPLGSTLPGRTLLWVDVDGVLVYAGILWQRRYADRALEISGAELGSYATRRILAETLTYTSTDQLEVCRDLWRRVMSPTSAWNALELGTETSGVAVDRQYPGEELKPYGELLDELAAGEPGYEWRIDPVYDPTGVPSVRLTLGYPMLGTRAAGSPLVWESPGNVESYSWPEDATAGGNVVHVAGAGEGVAMLRTSAYDTASLDAGYPLLESAATDYKDVISRDVLASHARAEVAARRLPLVVPDLTVRASSDPRVGAYLPGDDVRLRILDARHPTGLDAVYRLAGYTIRPADDTVELSLERPEVA